MSLSHYFCMAQATTALTDPNAAEMVAGLLVVLVMGCSLAMIVVWIVRLLQTGHALPAARRGVLRIPLPMMIVAVGLSLLMFLMMAFASLGDEMLPSAPVPVTTAQTETIPPKPAPGEPSVPETSTPSQDGVANQENADGTAAAEETAAGESAAGETQPSAANKAPAPLTAEEMQSRLISMVQIELLLFLGFGFFVLRANKSGRVRLPEPPQRTASTPALHNLSSSSVPGGNFWPDLDDGDAIPQLPGFSILGERTVSAKPAAPRPSASSPYSVLATPALETATSPEYEEVFESEEPFSFLTELRYAVEVFLAAYVPTALLRILIVLLTVGLGGEMPDQHPFLEMMKSGVGGTVLTLIVLTAVIMAPIVEELQFRVVVLGGIAQLGRPIWALSLSSILFALAHGFPDSFALLPLAFALGYAYLRRRSYITVMLVHFLFNGFNMALALVALL